MKKKKLLSDKNYLKMNIIYLLLIISNILLFIGLFKHYSNTGISLHLQNFDEFAIAIATMSILGYVSGVLPKIRGLGESSLYGIVYFLLICVIGLMTTYFDGKIDTSAFFGPYLEMFGILCGVLIFILMSTNLKSFKEILNGNYTRKNLLTCLLVFTIVGLFASYARIYINDAPANIRCLIVMISGLFGGPFVGIPVGIISGLYRFSLGGATALPCAISTVLSGVVGSLIFVWNRKKFLKIIPAIILMFLFTGFEMLLVVVLTPSNISFSYIVDIYPLMVFASVTGMLLFTIVIREAKEKMNSKPEEEDKIKEFENELKEYDKKIESLENEIRELKKDIEK